MKTSRVLLGGIALFLTTSCSDFARLVTPHNTAMSSAPANLALRATVSATGRDDAVQLQVNASYVRKDKQVVSLGSQKLTLSSAAVQAVPVPIDVGVCMSDPDRDAANDGSCPVILAIALVVNGTIVDQQVLGPLNLSPGATTSITEPVTLSVLAAIDVSVGDGPVLTPGQIVATTVGSTLQLHGIIKDDQGREVTNRVVGWSSESPLVASVASNGTVSVLAPGSARITASNGAVSASLVLNATLPPALLTVNALTGSGKGVVRSSPAGIDCRIDGNNTSGTCVSAFASGATVTLTGTADNGNRFLQWGNACTGSSVGGTCQLALTNASTIGAAFLATRHVTLLNAGGDGNGRITGSFGLQCLLASGSATGSCEVDVDDGAVVVLTTAPASGPAGDVSNQTFAGWSGACSGITGNTCVLNVNTNLAAGASYESGRQLAVQAGGTGNGTIASAVGINCVVTAGQASGTCVRAVPFGATTSLVATVGAFSTFDGWTGACAGSTGLTCQVTMSQALSVGATFTQQRVLLTLDLAGGGAGSVKVNGVTVCTLTRADGNKRCTQLVDQGSTVTLTGTASVGARFAGFNGQCQGTSSCSFPMTTATTLEASFLSELVTVSITAGSGSGQGTLVGTGASAGVACTLSSGVATGMCTWQFPYGTAVTLRATPPLNNMLSAWGGDCATSTGMTCDITVTGDTHLSASFIPAVNVRMNLTGNGTGFVIYDLPGWPQQDPCVANGTSPVVCTYAMPTANPGTFRATPTSGSSFSGFTGPCIEPGSSPWPTCTFPGFGISRDVRTSFNR